MEPVGERWGDFTALRQAPTVRMLVPVELLGDGADAEEFWSERVGGNGCAGHYPVWLECECGARKDEYATFEDDTADMDGHLWALAGLDARLRAFVDQHRYCREQMRMALDDGHEHGADEQRMEEHDHGGLRHAHFTNGEHDHRSEAHRYG